MDDGGWMMDDGCNRQSRKSQSSQCLRSSVPCGLKNTNVSYHSICLFIGNDAPMMVWSIR